MKLVMTLVCRDAAETIDAHIAFHLSAGVDLVIATDHRSEDGTTEVLERHAREGRLHLTREDGEFRQAEWVTRMARLAATDFGADWVINSDSDEFWWPRGSDLKRVLAAIPDRYGVVRALWRTFPPRPDDGRFFAERMTVRLAPVAPVNDPTTPWRPNAKVIHRADPRITVRKGNHTVEGARLQPLRGWYPVEVLHFPWRSSAHAMRKASSYWSVGMSHATGLAYEAEAGGELTDRYETFVVDDEALARGLADGMLAEDTRLRDVLRALSGASEVPPALSDRAFALQPQTPPLVFARPSVVDDVAFAVEAAVYDEAELVRAQRQLDELERRVAALERGPWQRAVRAARSAARRGRPS
jgi:Glycosyl transferase family 2